MEIEHRTNGWKIAFWIFFVLWASQAIYIWSLLNKQTEIKNNYSIAKSELSAQASTNNSQQQCIDQVHQKWDALIESMEAQQENAYGFLVARENGITDCKNQYPN